MKTEETSTKKAKIISTMPIFDQEHGFYNSMTIMRPLEDVADFLKKPANVEKVLKEIPEKLKNFLDLTLVSSTQEKIVWKNKPEAKVQGTLTYNLRATPVGRGTIVSAVADFEKLQWKDEEPSSLMSSFLHMQKALAETGVLATTKGQPSGREEIKPLQ